MELSEVKDRYKMMPMSARLALAVVLGLLPAAYIYLEEGDSLQVQLEGVQSQEAEARGKFEKARQRKASLPKLEEQLAFTEEQMLKARRLLPDDFRIEEVLERAATIAKETGVSLKLFDPQTEIKYRDASYKYVELPIATEIEGRFHQIASFLDRMVHLESSVFVRQIAIERLDPSGSTENFDRSQSSPHQLALEARQKLQEKASFNLVIYRSLSDAEASQPDQNSPMDALPPEAGKDPSPPPAGAGEKGADAGANAQPKGEG